MLIRVIVYMYSISSIRKAVVFDKGFFVSEILSPLAFLKVERKVVDS